MDTYEKKYNEALERAKELLLGNEHSNTIRSYFEHIFPELRESEDERIRKWIVEELEITRDAMSGKNDYSDDPDIVARLKRLDEALVWLEKRKEPKQTDLPAGFYYIDLDGNKYYSKEFRYGDMKLKVATATLDAEKQKELMPPVNVDPCDASCDAYYQRGLNKGYELGLEAGRKEQKPVQSAEEKEFIRTIKSIIADFIRDKKPEDVGFYQRIYDWLDDRHIEQKPVESWPNLSNCIHNCKKCFGRCIYRKEANPEMSQSKPVELTGELSTNDSSNPSGLVARNLTPEQMREETLKPVETSDFKTKLAAYLQNNSPKDGQYVISSESILQMAKEELIKRGELKEQKPAWSEEDETHLCWIIECFDSWKYQVPEFADQYQSAIDWLKSLRRQPQDDFESLQNDFRSHNEAFEAGREFERSRKPRWKPSEEQMDSLRDTIVQTKGYSYSMYLPELYEQLKKLM